MFMAFENQELGGPMLCLCSVGKLSLLPILRIQKSCMVRSKHKGQVADAELHQGATYSTEDCLADKPPVGNVIYALT